MRNLSTTNLAVTPASASQSAWGEEEQKLIDTARDILMRQRNLNADEAYGLLTEMAEKRKIGLPEIATQLVEISKMLTI